MKYNPELDAKIYKYEQKTTDRLEDEPWYSDYQGVVEVMCAGPNSNFPPNWFERLPDGREKALSACKEYLKSSPTMPSDERLLNWIESCWQSEENMKQIDELYLWESCYQKPLKIIKRYEEGKGSFQDTLDELFDCKPQEFPEEWETAILERIAKYPLDNDDAGWNDDNEWITIEPSCDGCYPVPTEEEKRENAKEDELWIREQTRLWRQFFAIDKAEKSG